MDWLLWLLLELLGAVGDGFVMDWTMNALNKGCADTLDVPAPDTARRPGPAAGRPGGFPVVNRRPVSPVGPNEDGPGAYRVVGLVRETSKDVELRVRAVTLANAKVKAELKGVIVTAVVKE